MMGSDGNVGEVMVMYICCIVRMSGSDYNVGMLGSDDNVGVVLVM